MNNDVSTSANTSMKCTMNYDFKTKMSAANTCEDPITAFKPINCKWGKNSFTVGTNMAVNFTTEELQTAWKTSITTAAKSMQMVANYNNGTTQYDNQASFEAVMAEVAGASALTLAGVTVALFATAF